MKKIIFIFFVVLTSMSNAQQIHTKVNFIHGMNGNSQSLTRIHNYLSNLQTIDLINPTAFYQPLYHSSTSGIGYTSYDIQKNIDASDPYYYTTPKKIVIAHSLGGLAARKWYTNIKASTGNDAYNGIITLNTPHLGTLIASKLSKEETRKVFDNGVKDAILKITEGASKDADGLLTEFVKDPAFQVIVKVGNLVGFNAIHTFANKIFGRLIDGILQRFNASNYILSNVAGSEIVLRDLSEGSTIIKEINQNDKNQTDGTYDTKVFKIAMYGDEKDPQVFRMFGSSFYTDSKGNNYELFDADNDLYLINYLSKATAVFDSRIHELRPETNKWWYTKSTCADKKAKRDAWIRSKEYLETDFHTFFLIELGLRISARCLNCGANDGLVTEKSQKGFPGAVPIRLEEVNHEEVKTCKESAYTLRAITNGSLSNLNKESAAHQTFFKIYKK